VAKKPTGTKRAVLTHSFKRRELSGADGGKLVLSSDGSIAQIDAAGATTKTWTTDDPDWAGMALRFGVQPQTETTVPDGRRVAAPRPHE
jgi:hypothetical protein